MAEMRSRISEALEQSRTEPPPREVARALFHEHLDLAAIRKALGHPSPANLRLPGPPVAEAAAPPLPKPVEEALARGGLALRTSSADKIAAWERPDGDLRPPPQRRAMRREAPPASSPTRWRMGLPAMAFLAGVVSAGVLVGVRWDGDAGQSQDRGAEAGDPVPEASPELARPVTVVQAPASPRIEIPDGAAALAPGRPPIGLPQIATLQPGLAEIRPPQLPPIPEAPAADVPPPIVAQPEIVLSSRAPAPPAASPALVPPIPVAAPLPPPLAPRSAEVVVPPMPVAATPAAPQSLAALRPPPAAAPFTEVAALPPSVPPAPAVAPPPAAAPAIRPPAVAAEAILPAALQTVQPPAPRPGETVALARAPLEDRPALAPPPAGSSRVVVHYAARAGAIPRETLTAALRRAGFARVEWRAVARTPSQTQIRFFHAGDRGLSNRAAAALGHTGLRALQEDFTHFQPPTTPGTVEIWLGG